MYETMLKFAPIIGVAIFSSGGTLALKRFADSGQTADLLWGLAAYMASNWFWIGVLRAEGLGYAVVVSSLTTTVFLTVVGVTAFGERIATMQIIGLGFALIAIVLFSLPTPNGAP